MENKEAIKLATSSLDITYDTNNIIAQEDENGRDRLVATSSTFP